MLGLELNQTCGLLFYTLRRMGGLLLSTAGVGPAWGVRSLMQGGLLVQSKAEDYSFYCSRNSYGYEKPKYLYLLRVLRQSVPCARESG